MKRVLISLAVVAILSACGVSCGSGNGRAVAGRELVSLDGLLTETVDEGGKVRVIVRKDGLECSGSDSDARERLVVSPVEDGDRITIYYRTWDFDDGKPYVRGDVVRYSSKDNEFWYVVRTRSFGKEVLTHDVVFDDSDSRGVIDVRHPGDTVFVLEGTVVGREPVEW